MPVPFHLTRFPIVAALLVLGACGTVAPGGGRGDVSGLAREVEALVARHPGATVAVAVRDAVTGTHFDLHADTVFHAASTMKVPVMVEVFRQAVAGRFALDDSLVVANAFRSIVDGSPYAIEDDSDDAIYGRLGGHMAIRDLVYQMITVSSNLATNLLIELVSADSVQATLARMGARRMRVLRGVEDLKAFRQGLNNTATAADLALVFDAIGRGAAISPEASAEMTRILLDQRFDAMIPAGLPPGARAAHKTGSITGIEHDAGLVFSPGAAPYALVVLTRGFNDPADAARLGAEITAAVHRSLRPAR